MTKREREQLEQLEQHLLETGGIKHISEKDIKYRRGLVGLSQAIKAAGEAVRAETKQMKAQLETANK